MQGELDRVSQTLTGRIRELAERYATPLPQLTDEVATLAARVEEHLEEDGGVMEVRPGYKQTEVGVIPEDWEVDALERSSRRMTTASSMQTRSVSRWCQRHPRIRIIEASERIMDGMLRRLRESIAQRCTIDGRGQATSCLRCDDRLGEVRHVRDELVGAILTSAARDRLRSMPD